MPAGQTQTFRGRDRRLRTRFRARIPFVLKNNSQQVRGITSNISLLGISAYTENPVGPVQPVQCVLEVPQSRQPIVAHGTVIRCEALREPHPDGPYQMGVFFKEFEARGESSLAHFLEELQQEEQKAIQAGYRDLKKRLLARQRRKRMEALRKRRRRLERLKKRRRRLAKLKRLKALRQKRRRERRRAKKKRSLK